MNTLAWSWSYLLYHCRSFKTRDWKAGFFTFSRTVATIYERYLWNWRATRSCFDITTTLPTSLRHFTIAGSVNRSGPINEQETSDQFRWFGWLLDWLIVSWFQDKENSGGIYLSSSRCNRHDRMKRGNLWASCVAFFWCVIASL